MTESEKEGENIDESGTGPAGEFEAGSVPEEDFTDVDLSAAGMDGTPETEEEELSEIQKIPGEDLLTDAVGENEGEDRWSISLVYYDSMSEFPKEPIPAAQDLIWHAQQSTEKRRITIQVNYRNENTVQTYQPGELEILLDDLAWLYAPSRIADNVECQIAADRRTDEVKLRDWSWERFTDPVTGRRRLRFTNNDAFEKNTNFEGSIQVSWNLEPAFGITDHSFQIEADMRDCQAVPLHMEYTSAPKVYRARKTPLKIASMDGLVPGDYIWVKFEVRADATETDDGVRFLDPGTVYFEDRFPEDVIVLDHEMKQLHPSDEGIYRFSPEPWTGSARYMRQMLSANIYAGYPRTVYEAEQITNEIEVYGVRFNVNAWTGDGGDITMAARADCTFAAADFIFTYQGDLYGLKKNAMQYSTNSGSIRTDGEVFTFALSGTATWTGSPMNVRIGDDLAGILYETGEFRFLNDQERWFLSVRLPKFVNKNKIPLSAENYSCNLYVRDAGAADYRLYARYTENKERTVSFGESERIAGWFVELEGLEESLELEYLFSKQIYMVMKVRDPSVTDTGTVYNFAYMQVYINGIPQISASIDNYGNLLTREYAGTYDLSTYGRYMLRAWASYDFKKEETGVYATKSFRSFQKDSAAECFRSTVNAKLQYGRSLIGGFNRIFRGFQAYDLLPAGMKLSAPGEFALQAESGVIRYVYRPDGTPFASRTEYEDYARAHTRIEAVQNWKGTGRTLVRILVDYTDAPLDISRMNSLPVRTASTFIQNITDLTVSFEINVPFDSFLEYGPVWKNRLYVSEYGLDNLTDIEGNSLALALYTKDDGTHDADAVDLDEDGVTNEVYGWTTGGATIMDTASTHQDVTTYVQTDRQEYTTGTAVSTESAVYTYKLRVRTGEDRVTSLQIYDSLETADEGENSWKGTFEDVDTSFAVSQGYQVEVWYSENPLAGILGEDETWERLTQETDRQKVKALAFAYMDNKGNPVVFPAQAMSYVLIKMRAVSETHPGSLASNGCRTRWTALDEFDRPVYDITGIRSNVVHVSLPSAELPPARTYLTLTKAIRAEDVVWSHGEPVFGFVVEGNDENGTAHRYIQMLSLSQEQNAAQDGMLGGSVQIDVPAGTWEVSELPCMRYSLKEIRDVENGELRGNKASFVLDGREIVYGSAVFENQCIWQEDLSDCALVRNRIG
ncbi:MAG: hypothetical protein IKE03_10280 [Blautia sp.]|nr:hypothetical protein [Blautia sp.]